MALRTAATGLGTISSWLCSLMLPGSGTSVSGMSDEEAREWPDIDEAAPPFSFRSVAAAAAAASASLIVVTAVTAAADLLPVGLTGVANLVCAARKRSARRAAAVAEGVGGGDDDASSLLGSYVEGNSFLLGGLA